MTQFSVGLLTILAFCATYSCAAFSVEDKLQELEKKFEEKVIELETQLEINKNLRQDLALKVTQLEAKVQDQENILSSLLQAARPVNDAEIIANSQSTAIPSAERSEMPRTCRELSATDPSLTSGMHWIDPDGPQDGGDEPIYVYCNMTTGTTSISHDSEFAIDVGHCANPGCYSRSINYNASMRQMKVLIDLSAECHQTIKFDCYYAPFELNGVVYAWWNDRDGNPQYFWAGKKTNVSHTCQCGIDRNCVDSVVKCNCDTISPVQLIDAGDITDKKILPVTRLNFGRTQLETSSGIHTLGQFECSGTPSAGLPTSCDDLSRIGHTLSGFYSIMGSERMESVFCDFTKLPADAGFQKWIGYADVKSASVHFYVQREDDFKTTGIIPFHSAQVNEGNAMNLTSGIFTAPQTGTYYFAFTAHAVSSSIPNYVQVSLYKNNWSIAMSECTFASASYSGSPLTLQSTMNLIKGDRIWMQMYKSPSSDAYLKDYKTSTYPPYPGYTYSHFTHFTGFMLDEKIVTSL